jgi:hypothetical protein
LTAELAAARRELFDLREQVGLLREENARLRSSCACASLRVLRSGGLDAAAR